jgi:hypothetical protein
MKTVRSNLKRSNNYKNPMRLFTVLNLLLLATAMPPPATQMEMHGNKRRKIERSESLDSQDTLISTEYSSPSSYSSGSSGHFQNQHSRAQRRPRYSPGMVEDMRKVREEWEISERIVSSHLNAAQRQYDVRGDGDPRCVGARINDPPREGEVERYLDQGDDQCCRPEVLHEELEDEMLVEDD